MDIPPNLEALAKPLDEKQLPNVFLGELQHFDWGMELCDLNGRPGGRIVFAPSLLPFIKLSVPFNAFALERFRNDIDELITALNEQNESSSQA